MRKHAFFNLIILAALSLVTTNTSAQSNKNYISIEDRDQLYDWFRYSPNRDIVISGHRGGMLPGYPENSIEAFEKTLSFMTSFCEIDPRLTKDGVIVWMHAEAIKRTTTGT